MELDVDAALRALYDQVPSANCKGLCQDSCGPIPMSKREHEILLDRGVDIPHDDDAMKQWEQDGFTCPALVEGKCSVYDDRPLICRLWGSVDHPLMKCEHGCEPAGGLLPQADAADLINKSVQLGGER